MTQESAETVATATDDRPPVVQVTPAAREVVEGARAQEPDAEHLGLWIEVSGVADGAYTYDIYFQPTADAGRGDVVDRSGDLPLIVPAASAERLRGARLDWSDEGEGGLVIINPNTPPPATPADVTDLDMDGDLARRVLAVLDEMVNPSIASHGGRADLVGVSEASGTAFLRLSGGCQGCGMARVTLSQGIEVALRDEIPEIVRVVDVTDHASGENPYFEPAKK